MGSVKTCNTGLKKVFKKPKTNATVNAAVKPSIWTSDKMCATKNIARVLASIEITIFMPLL